MARTKISEFSATPSDNTDIDGIDIAEGCAPSGINNAIREMMAQLKDFQTGSAGDPFNGAINGTVGATTPSTVVATQVDITAQGDLRLQDTTGGQYVALQAPGTIATSYTLTLPVDDGTSGQALITDGSGVLSWSTAASGDVYGPASATDNAVARYDGTTGKIIQNSAVTIGDNGATVIAANSSSDGLRITQIGAGNALLVEDSANPDATPFVIDGSGNTIVGYTSSLATAPNAGPLFQVHRSSSSVNFASAGITNWVAAGTACSLQLSKSRSGTIGTQGIVSSGDGIGRIQFNGDDGTQFFAAASIDALVDGTPGTNDMPGRLTFSTTADGASSPTERMRIDSAGRIGVGTSTLTGYGIRTAQNITGAVISQGIGLTANVQSDVTTSARGVWSNLGTQATAFTLNNLVHFYSQQGTIGAGSTVTNQFGFAADSGLTGATNNYGFYGNIASGTGRWNFYAAGTADNYFAGALGLGATAITGSLPVNIGYTLTGATSVVNVRAIPTIASDVTSSAALFRTQPFTQAAAFTLGALTHFDATLGSIGATSAIANQYGFSAGASLIGATNNFGFYGAIASGTGRFNFYAQGTAANVFVGTTSIGGVVGAESLRVTPTASAVNYFTIAGSATTGAPTLNAQGSDTNIGAGYISKGTGTHFFATGGSGGNVQFNIAHTASAVNYLQVTGSATGNAVTMSAVGSDTNIDLALTPKGTGKVRFGTHTASADVAISGYIEVKDSAGNVRKLAVIT